MSQTFSLNQKNLDSYREQGYVICREAFRRQRIQSLVEAVNHLIDRVLAGECEIRWIDRVQRLPARIGHMLHPDKYDPAFAAWLDEDLARQIEVLVGGPARHSLFGMLASGGGEPYKQAWHRDLGKSGEPDEVEFLRRSHGEFVQFNAPLLPGDRFLNILPASHLRASTAVEVQASKAGEEGNMPEGMVVELDPGDIVYYNANLWHRGWNPDGVNRWTVHAAFWIATYPVMKHEYGQREAMLTPGHLDRMPPIT